MKKRAKTGIILLLLIFLLCFTMPAIAEEAPAEEITPGDMERLLADKRQSESACFTKAREAELTYWSALLDLSPAEEGSLRENRGLAPDKGYLLRSALAADLAAIEADVDRTEAEKIRWLVEKLFQLRVLDRYLPFDADFTPFLAEAEPTDPGLQYFLDWARFIKAAEQIYRAQGAEPPDLAVLLNFRGVRIEGDSAQVFVDVKEMSRRTEGEIGSATPEYTISLRRTAEGWRIDAISSDDGQEQYYLSSGKRLDVEARLAELTAPPAMPQNIRERNAATEKAHQQYLKHLTKGKRLWGKGQMAMSSYISYTRNWAKSFALTYATNPCSAYFPFISGADCQNFASQCVWYGFGGTLSPTAIANKNYPMIASGARAWHPSISTWTYVPDFEDYMDDGGYTVAGPYGFLYYGDLRYTQVGDIIQVNWEGSAAPNNLDHAYIVNAVTGSYGSRGVNNIYVCAHTSTCDNVCLNYTGYGQSRFLLISVGDWVSPN